MNLNKKDSTIHRIWHFHEILKIYEVLIEYYKDDECAVGKKSIQVKGEDNTKKR